VDWKVASGDQYFLDYKVDFRGVIRVSFTSYLTHLVGMEDV